MYDVSFSCKQYTKIFWKTFFECVFISFGIKTYLISRFLNSNLFQFQNNHFSFNKNTDILINLIHNNSFSYILIEQKFYTYYLSFLHLSVSMSLIVINSLHCK